MFGLFGRKTPDAEIHLYNTAARKKELFTPLKACDVSMYACGPTVYDHMHIGNLRAYLLPDLLHRLFRYHGHTVNFTVNVTDFGHLTDDGDAGEDKIMNGMRREGYEITLENMRTFAEPYIESFKTDLATFGNLAPSTITRASDYVREQIALIDTLVQKEYAYETSDGVYFDVSTYPAYGVLGNVDIDAMKAGARVETNPEKRHPADFALWKKGALGWKSRWGTGFPGWHIECTAMAFATLGKQIDIHTGGEDLMYTHHNGEIAQAESLTKKQYVRYWLHNAHISVNDEKLAKSKGTGIRLEELIEKGYSPFDYRYWLLQSHYRTPANFSYDALESARQALLRLRRFVYEECADIPPAKSDKTYEQRFVAAMNDDLDTPKAIAILWELVKDDSLPREVKLATVHAVDPLVNLGLSLSNEEGQKELGVVDVTDIPEDLQKLLDERAAARTQKDWKKADELRDTILKAGYTVEDTASGPRLTRT